MNLHLDIYVICHPCLELENNENFTHFFVVYTNTLLGILFDKTLNLLSIDKTIFPLIVGVVSF